MNSCTLHYYFYNVFIKKERGRCLFRTSTACPQSDRFLGLEIKHIRHPELQHVPIWNCHHILSRSAAGLCLAMISLADKGWFLLLCPAVLQRSTETIYSAWQPFRYWTVGIMFPWDRLSSSLNISSFFRHSSSVMLSAAPPSCLPPSFVSRGFQGGVPSTASGVWSGCIRWRYVC